MRALTPTDIQRIRRDFPMLTQTMHGKPLVYLDSAATAQKPKEVINTITSFYSDHYGTVHRAVYQLALHSTEDYQKTRKKVKSLLHAAREDEIIFTRGSTESINMVAYSFGKAFVKPGDEILISAMEHHSNIVPWQILCEDRGAILKVIPINEKGELLLKEYATLLNSRTRLVAIAHISNALGTLNPIKQIVEMAHHMGAKVLVDGAQSVSHIPVDVQDLDADFYTFSGHKIMGPTGIGVLYGKAELLNQMPPYQGGGDMIESVDFSQTTYNILPFKFEAGTPMIAEVMGLGAAIDYIQSIGIEAIHDWENKLMKDATSQMKQIPGLKIIGQASQKGSLISFIIDGVHSLDIGTFLDLKGIAIRTGHHCAQPLMRFFNVPATARVSFACYNTKEEVEFFVDSLRDVVHKLK